MKFVVYLSLFSICLLSIIGGAALQGVHINALIQPTSFFGVFGFTLAFFLIRYGYRDFILALQYAFEDEAVDSEKQKQAEEVFRFVGKLLFISGALCAFVGILHLLYHNTDSSKLGAGIATGFIAVFYATCGRLLLTIPLEMMCRRNEKSILNDQIKELIVPFISSVFTIVGTVTLLNHWLETPLFKSIFVNLVIVSFSACAFYLRFSQLTDWKKLTAFMQSIVLGSLLAFIISLIHTMQNLAEGEHMWRGVAIAFTGPFYAILIFGVLFAFKERVKIKTANIYQDIAYGCFSILILSVLFGGTLFSLSYSKPLELNNTSYSESGNGRH